MDRETTAGINKHYLAWGFPKFFNGSLIPIFDLARLLLPPGNQRDRHNFFATFPNVAVLANIINLRYLSPKVATVLADNSINSESLLGGKAREHALIGQSW